MTYNITDLKQVIQDEALHINTASNATNKTLWYMLIIHANGVTLDDLQNYVNEFNPNASSHKTKVLTVYNAIKAKKITGYTLPSLKTLSYHKDLFSISSKYQELKKATPTKTKTPMFTKLQNAIKDPSIDTGLFKSANAMIEAKKTSPMIAREIERITKEYDNRQFALIFPNVTTENIKQVSEQVLKYISEIAITDESLYINLLTDISALSVELDAQPTQAATRKAA